MQEPKLAQMPPAAAASAAAIPLDPAPAPAQLSNPLKDLKVKLEILWGALI